MIVINQSSELGKDSRSEIGSFMFEWQNKKKYLVLILVWANHAVFRSKLIDVIRLLKKLLGEAHESWCALRQYHFSCRVPYRTQRTDDLCNKKEIILEVMKRKLWRNLNEMQNVSAYISYRMCLFGCAIILIILGSSDLLAKKSSQFSKPNIVGLIRKGAFESKNEFVADKMNHWNGMPEFTI